MSVIDDVGTGAWKYLSQFSDVTSLLGSFPSNDPIVANQNQPWLFTGDILTNIKGSSSIAVVVSDFGGWSPPPQLGSQRFRRLRVDIWVDPVRSSGNVSSTSAATVNRGNQVFNAIHRHLHRRDPDTVVWGDLVTFGCQLLSEPQFALVPDGDWSQLGSATYGVYIAGWTDSLS